MRHRRPPMFRLALLPAVALADGWASTAAAQPAGGPGDKVAKVADAAPNAADAAQRQVAAALADALETLRRDVLATPFDAERTIDQVVRRLDASLAFSKAVQSADQFGSPRWRDDGACELRMVLAGSAVADALEWAADQPHAKKVKFADSRAMRDGLARLRRRTFSAVGIGVAAGRLDVVRPDSAPWRGVPADDRAAALRAARADAVNGVMDNLAAVPLAGGKSLRDALALPDVADPIHRWLAARPVASVEFREDLKVRLILAVPADELWPVVRAALERNRLGPAPDDGAGWERLRAELARAVPQAEGRGSVPGDRPRPQTLPVAAPVVRAT
ncbi:MAG TPA: hypothetical protein VF796_22700, partial [Humisphaera sp.]